MLPSIYVLTDLIFVAVGTFVRVYAIRNILRDTGCLEELQKRVSTITRALRSYGNPHAGLFLSLPLGKNDSFVLISFNRWNQR